MKTGNRYTGMLAVQAVERGGEAFCDGCLKTIGDDSFLKLFFRPIDPVSWNEEIEYHSHTNPRCCGLVVVKMFVDATW